MKPTKISSKTGLLLSFLRIPAFFALCASPAMAVGDRDYVGINNGTGYNTDPTYVARNIAADRDLGVGSVRMGMDGIGGFRVTEPFKWEARDKVVDAYRAARLEIRAVISPRLMVERDPDPQKWHANWRRLAASTFAHFKGRVFYYIIDNEPDVNYGNGLLTAQQCFDLTQIAYQEAKLVDARILIESPPPNSPESRVLREMLALDIGSVCDFIGLHAYGAQIDEKRLGTPWKWLRELNTTRRPLVISESGAIDSYFKTGAQGRREWMDRYYVQLKRWGYAHVMLFDLDGHRDWALLTQSLEKSPSPQPRPAYVALKEGYRVSPLSAFNGGFEQTNDPRYDWYPYTDSESYDLAHWANFSAADARTGTRCLELTLAPKTTRFARRVIGPLVPGRGYTLSAWARPETGATATLSADGTQLLEGDKSFAASTQNASGWQPLNVAFTPTTSWVVVTLSGTGGDAQNRVRFDDVELR